MNNLVKRPAGSPPRGGSAGRAQLKLRLAAFSSAVLLTAGLALAYAVPATAADEVNLCVEPWADGNGGVGCAFDIPQLGSQVSMDNAGPISLWNVPTTAGHYGQISYYGDGGSGSSSRCFEVDAGIKVGKNDGIRLETCAGKASEEWLPVKGTNAEGKTYYELISEYGTTLCLNADPNSDPQAPSAAPCTGSTDQQWLATLFGP